MSKYTGLKCKVLIAPLGEGVPQIVGGQRDADLNIENAEIDATSKDNEGGNTENIAGLRSWNVSCSGAHIRNDEVLETIEDSLLEEEHTPDRGMFQLWVKMESGKVYKGIALCTSYGRSLPHADLVTYSLSFNGNGGLSKELAAPTAIQKGFDALEKGAKK